MVPEYICGVLLSLAVPSADKITSTLLVTEYAAPIAP